ncbi:MAG: DUF99 family protein [Nitrososphaeraceae archaeon]
MEINKKGIRVLAIAESFRKGSSNSVISGVVMRKDLVVDGIVFGNTTIEGDDATENIISMYKNLHRNDINFLLLDGLIISMYNIVDGKLIHENLKIPVIAISFKNSQGIENSIKKHFPFNYNNKIKNLRQLGKRDLVVLKTNKVLWIRFWGINLEDAIKLLNSFLLQGAVPEPIKLAKMISHAYLYKLAQ